MATGLNLMEKKTGKHNWLVVEPTPSEKYESNWKSSPIGDEHKKYLKPQPR